METTSKQKYEVRVVFFVLFCLLALLLLGVTQWKQKIQWSQNPLSVHSSHKTETSRHFEHKRIK